MRDDLTELLNGACRDDVEYLFDVRGALARAGSRPTLHDTVVVEDHPAVVERGGWDRQKPSLRSWRGSRCQSLATVTCRSR